MQPPPLVEAPIKRMSILERRAGDDRAFFLRHWREVHGGMVSNMPYLYGYQQNHVIEAIGDDQAFPADGFVEQLWRSGREMQAGYASPAVEVMIRDEPNYLGHGSNYAAIATAKLRHVGDGSKLLCTVHHGGNIAASDRIYAEAKAIFGEATLLRDDVLATVAKPNMLPTPPRPADMFLHIYALDAASALKQGEKFMSVTAEVLASDPTFRLSLHRVVTYTII